MTVLMICLVLASITELFKSRKLFCLCCSFQLLIGFIGLAVTLWIYWTGINNDVKDFMFGLIVSSYFMVRELSGGGTTQAVTKYFTLVHCWTGPDGNFMQIIVYAHFTRFKCNTIHAHLYRRLMPLPDLLVIWLRFSVQKIFSNFGKAISWLSTSWRNMAKYVYLVWLHHDHW